MNSFFLLVFLLPFANHAIANTVAETISMNTITYEGEDIVKENFVYKSDNEDTDSFSTKVCFYKEGAVINRKVIVDSSSKSSNTVVVPNLSSEVIPQSIMIFAPDSVNVIEFREEDSIKPKKLKKNKEEEEKFDFPKISSSGQVIPKNLVIKTLNNNTITNSGVWDIRYCTKGISWKAHHVIEVARSGHITFLTIITIQNNSGINLSNAQVKFIDKEMPADLEDNLRNSALSNLLVYTYNPLFEIRDKQTKSIINAHAKHVEVATNSGLFVGGKYLNKMEKPEYLKIGSWIVFPNIKAIGLGSPIPSGKVLIYCEYEGQFVLSGFSEIQQVNTDDNITVRMPDFSQYQSYDVFSSVAAKLSQENYRKLTPMISEAEYTLSLQNFQNAPVTLRVTLNCDPGQKYSIARSNIKHDKDKNGDSFFTVEIQPKATKEVKYKLIINNG